MSSPADRFSRLQKVAIFLIALGQERSREILADIDVDTVEQLNGAIASLGRVTAEEKASVMLEFARFFYEDTPLKEGGKAAPARTARGREARPKEARRKKARPEATRRTTAAEAPGGGQPGPAGKPAGSPPPGTEPPSSEPPGSKLPGSELTAKKADGGAPDLTDEEQTILNALDKLRRRLDPGQIDWGRAGYDFGEGFKGLGDSRR